MDNPQLNNQWLVAQALHLNPLGEDIQNMNPLQIEWCLRMIEKFSPGTFKFKSEETAPQLHSASRWTEILEGEGLRKYLENRLPPYKRGTVQIR